MGPYIDGDETLAIRYIDMTRFGKKLESNICYMHRNAQAHLVIYSPLDNTHEWNRWADFLRDFQMKTTSFTWYYSLNYIL